MPKDIAFPIGAEADASRLREPIRVAVLGAQGASSPSFRIRGALPGAALADYGIQVFPMPLFSAEQDRVFRNARGWAKARSLLSAHNSLRARLPAPVDVAWILRQADLLPSLRMETKAIGGRRFVLDIDDPVWLDWRPSAGGHPLAFLKGSRRKVQALARRADVVVAGNAYLADWLGQYAERVTVIPSLVDTDRSAERSHRNDETVVLGWIGSSSSFRHLQDLAAPLAHVASIAPDVRFELWSMGGGDIAIPGMRCVSVPWSEAAEKPFLERLDVGLMPLANNPWTRGKCAYKAIQYMAARIPVVADDVGVSAEVIGDGHAGRVVSSPGEWTEAIVSLARDADLRGRLGARGRRRAIADYSFKRWLPELANVLTGTTKE
jgi:glycosyltransferase involved in cell wall biosynthesis